MECWAIKDWDEVFEDRRSREVKRLKVVPDNIDRFLNSEAGTILLSGTDRDRSALAVFGRLKLVAARMPVRGVLCDEKGPLTVARMATRVKCSVEVMQSAIEVLSSSDIGWLLQVEAPTTKQGIENQTADEKSQKRRDSQKSADVPPTESPKNGTKKHTLHNITEQQQQRGEDAAAVSPESVVKAEARAALVEIGITEKTLSELVGLPYITAKIVRDEAKKATAAGKGLGVVVISLRSRCLAPPKTTTRHIESTGGLQVNGKLPDFDRSTLTENDKAERAAMFRNRKQGGAA